MNKKGFAFILARKGSKGLPHKNIRHLGGRPLIEWTLNYLCESEKIDRVCISTDDKFILDRYRNGYNDKILMHRRPDELGADYTTTEEVLVDACEAMKAHIQNNHFGVYMQITEPFRPRNILDLCIDKFKAGSHDSVFAATEYHKNFWTEGQSQLKRISNNKDFYTPRQKKKSTIREDTGICLVSEISTFIKGKRIGDKPGYVFYDHPGSMVDIHSESDLNFAKSLIKLGIID